MNDDPYGDEQLVELYDLDNPSGIDHDYFRALADELKASKLVDFGCGTGLLTRTFATGNRVVIGIDPSKTMLDYARRQPGADAVRWIDGDFTAVEQTGDADLVVSSGNTMMHISSEDFPQVLTALAGALRPGGVISFESRNPAARAWEQWTREATYGERDTPAGHLREWLDLTEVDVAEVSVAGADAAGVDVTGADVAGADVAGADVAGVASGRVAFDAYNVFEDGREVVLKNVLYFRTADEITDGLTNAGFGEVDLRSGWRAEPFSEESRLIVVRARKK